MLSAIVPTHNRPDMLRDCLRTLQAQDVATSEFEVVVVDDGSAADIAPVVSEVAAGGPIAMRCERQPLAGLNLARNRGISISGGEILAFLDDDTLVCPGWARALLAAFRDHSCAGVGGRVKLHLDGPEPDWLSTYRCFLAEYDLGEEPLWLVDHPLPVGANCAVRRVEVERIGGFRPGLDRHGGSLVSNGDTDFFRRLRAAGGRLRYEPGAEVTHRVPADRLTLDYFGRRFRAQGVSDELLAADGRPFSWRRRAGMARFAMGGAKWMWLDRMRGGDGVAGLRAMEYWAGRFTAYRR